MNYFEGYDIHIIETIKKEMENKLENKELTLVKKKKYEYLIKEADATIKRKKRIVKEQFARFIGGVR